MYALKVICVIITIGIIGHWVGAIVSAVIVW
jgi:type III secretory pathway component EscS